MLSFYFSEFTLQNYYMGSLLSELAETELILENTGWCITPCMVWGIQPIPEVSPGKQISR
jgi:hypothetical protein